MYSNSIRIAVVSQLVFLAALAIVIVGGLSGPMQTSACCQTADAPAKILLVSVNGDEGKESAPGFYLTTCMEELKQSEHIQFPSFELTTKTELTEQRDKLDQYSVVILNDVPKLSGEDGTALLSFVEKGGCVWTICGKRVDVDSFNKALYRDGKGILPGKLSEAEELDDVALDFMKGADVYKLDFLEPVPIERAMKVDAIDDKATSVWWAYSNGDPAVVERELGQGKCVLTTTSFDGTWSLLPASPAFVVVTDIVLGDLLDHNRLVVRSRVFSKLQKKLGANLRKQSRLRQQQMSILLCTVRGVNVTTADTDLAGIELRLQHIAPMLAEVRKIRESLEDQIEVKGIDAGLANNLRATQLVSDADISDLAPTDQESIERHLVWRKLDEKNMEDTLQAMGLERNCHSDQYKAQTKLIIEQVQLREEAFELEAEMYRATIEISPLSENQEQAETEYRAAHDSLSKSLELCRRCGKQLSLVIRKDGSPVFTLNDDQIWGVYAMLRGKMTQLGIARQRVASLESSLTGKSDAQLRASLWVLAQQKVIVTPLSNEQKILSARDLLEKTLSEQQKAVDELDSQSLKLRKEFERCYLVAKEYELARGVVAQCVADLNCFGLYLAKDIRDEIDGDLNWDSKKEELGASASDGTSIRAVVTELMVNGSVSKDDAKPEAQQVGDDEKTQALKTLIADCEYELKRDGVSEASKVRLNATLTKLNSVLAERDE